MASDPAAPPLIYKKAFVKVPWRHLPSLTPFELIERSGEQTKLSDFHGKPLVVSFFYADCPTICRELNGRIKLLQEQFRNRDVVFLSVTCDPDADTPDRLKDYAETFNADSEKWLFLTGSMKDIESFASQSFDAVVERPNHTEDIFLIDRWGRYRDRFRWDDAEEMDRFGDVMQEVLEETEPPIDATFVTRNVLAGQPPNFERLPTWIREFHLTTSEGKPFFSRDLTGRVWIGSIFFSTCTTHCVRQNEYLRDLQDRLPAGVVIASITTQPQHDTPDRLAQYATEIKANPSRWFFLTGKHPTYVRRIIGEFFGLFSQGEDHGTELAVVDRWGHVRGKFDWKKPEQEAEMFQLIEALKKETRPTISDPDIK